jgi:hypothetical protein
VILKENVLKFENRSTISHTFYITPVEGAMDLCRKIDNVMITVVPS